MNELDELFIKYETDKSSKFHSYHKIYEEILFPFIDIDMNLFISGIGGYNTNRGGGDLLAFKEYLPKAKIVGIDIYDKSFLNQDRITTYICSEDDEITMKGIIMIEGIPDVIINDGSHCNLLVIKNFKLLFPILKSGGVFVIEDIETSWYGSEEYEGCWDGNDFTANTTINFFRKLINELNGQYIAHFKSEYEWAKDIESISYYKNIIIVRKK